MIHGNLLYMPSAFFERGALEEREREPIMRPAVLYGGGISISSICTIHWIHSYFNAFLRGFLTAFALQSQLLSFRSSLCLRDCLNMFQKGQCNYRAGRCNCELCQHTVQSCQDKSFVIMVDMCIT